MRGKQEPISVRFWQFVSKSDGCWAWTGSKNTSGYGYIGLTENGKMRMIRAHRYSYELSVGPIPDGLWVLHRCDNRLCVNPDHLFLGTRADNMRDAYAKGRTNLQRPGVLPRGEHHPKAKLTEAQARDIRERRRRGEPVKALANEYGVSGATISNTANGRYWKG